MSNELKTDLKSKILEEMVVNHSNALEKNFELAKNFVRITSEGKVDVLHKDQLGGKEQVLLYLIGKLYAKEVELADSECVGNNELREELGVIDASLRGWLKKLRDTDKIKPNTQSKYKCHYIPSNLVERTLKSIEKKLNID